MNRKSLIEKSSGASTSNFLKSIPSTREAAFYKLQQAFGVDSELFHAATTHSKNAITDKVSFEEMSMLGGQLYDVFITKTLMSANKTIEEINDMRQKYNNAKELALRFDQLCKVLDIDAYTLMACSKSVKTQNKVPPMDMKARCFKGLIAAIDLSNEQNKKTSEQSAKIMDEFFIFCEQK
jgi:hypothetical protein